MILTVCVVRSLPVELKKSSVTSLLFDVVELGFVHAKLNPVDVAAQSHSEIEVRPGKVIGVTGKPSVTEPGLPTVDSASKGTKLKGR